MGKGKKKEMKATSEEKLGAVINGSVFGPFLEVKNTYEDLAGLGSDGIRASAEGGSSVGVSVYRRCEI